MPTHSDATYRTGLATVSVLAALFAAVPDASATPASPQPGAMAAVRALASEIASPASGLSYEALVITPDAASPMLGHLTETGDVKAPVAARLAVTSPSPALAAIGRDLATPGPNLPALAGREHSVAADRTLDTGPVAHVVGPPLAARAVAARTGADPVIVRLALAPQAVMPVPPLHEVAVAAAQPTAAAAHAPDAAAAKSAAHAPDVPVDRSAARAPEVAPDTSTDPSPLAPIALPPSPARAAASETSAETAVVRLALAPDAPAPSAPAVDPVAAAIPIPAPAASVHEVAVMPTPEAGLSTQAVNPEAKAEVASVAVLAAAGDIRTIDQPSSAAQRLLAIAVTAPDGVPERANETAAVKQASLSRVDTTPAAAMPVRAPADLAIRPTPAKGEQRRRLAGLDIARHHNAGYLHVRKLLRQKSPSEQNPPFKLEP